MAKPRAIFPATKARPGWHPTVGQLARYESRYSTLSKGCPVRVTAEAVGGRWRVQIIGRSGAPVFVTVKTANLHPMPPSLFDDESEQAL